MINIQDFVGKNNLFRKFVVDELLFVEIVCPVEDATPKNNLWWHHNFFAFAMAGQMVLKTLKDNYTFKAGDCIFAKKGSIMASYHLTQEVFCELRIFVPDDFIRAVVNKYKIGLSFPCSNEKYDTLIHVDTDEVLETYFHSLLAYFSLAQPPAETLLKLKFEELIVHLLSQPGHESIKQYFREVCTQTKPFIQDIMETNFPYNLSIRDFARLCARGLTAFKLEFNLIYNTTPGKWLLEKRLQYARFLFENSKQNVDEVALLSGFQNSSHFVRVFKDRFGNTPGKYRLERRSYLGK